jgi:hypothetical protein
MAAPEYGDSAYGDWDFQCFNEACSVTLFRGFLGRPARCPGCGDVGVTT